MKNQPVCHVCTADQTRIMAPLQSEIDGQDYQAVKCYACGLIFAHPIPKQYIQLGFERGRDESGY